MFQALEYHPFDQTWPISLIAQYSLIAVALFVVYPRMDNRLFLAGIGCIALTSFGYYRFTGAELPKTLLDRGWQFGLGFIAYALSYRQVLWDTIGIGCLFYNYWMFFRSNQSGLSKAQRKTTSLFNLRQSPSISLAFESTHSSIDCSNGCTDSYCFSNLSTYPHNRWLFDFNRRDATSLSFLGQPILLLDY
jgi:hypothetical protein